VAAIRALGAEQTLHAVERDVGEQGRDDAALRRAHRRRVQRAELDHAGFEPAPDRGGEHRQTREQRRVIDAIEGRHDTLPTSRCRDLSGSFGDIIHLKGERSKSSAVSIDMAGCV